MIIGITKETFLGERRVALIPEHVSLLKKLKADVKVESGAGVQAGFTDDQYTSAGAEIVTDRAGLFAVADIVLQVRALGANPDAGKADMELIRKGQTIIGAAEPLTEVDAIKQYADKGAMLFALELIPRITRAQSMDILSSMATIAGYKAVLLAAGHLPRMFPMMMTAAGTIKPAKALIIGAGVAGLQALASAKRLGAVVYGYDIRPAVKEQVESLGAKFVEMELETGAAEDSGGYAKAMDEDFYRKQRELMTRVVADMDVVITTAAVPSKKAPILITADMVRGMSPGSIIVDLAAERGGNCELTKPGEDVVENGVTIMGPTNLPSTIPYHASQMYGKNIVNLLKNMIKDGELIIDMDDEITSGTLTTKDGEVIEPRIRETLGLEVKQVAEGSTINGI